MDVPSCRKDTDKSTAVVGSTHVLSILKASLVTGALSDAHLLTLRCLCVASLSCTAAGKDHGLHLELPERNLELQGSSEAEVSRTAPHYTPYLSMPGTTDSMARGAR